MVDGRRKQAAVCLWRGEGEGRGGGIETSQRQRVAYAQPGFVPDSLSENRHV